MSLDLSIHKKRPGKWRQQIQHNNTKMISVINGKTGWEVNQFTGINEPIDYDDAKIHEYNKSMTIDSLLWHLKGAGAQIKYIKDEMLEGKETHYLEAEENIGQQMGIWIDTSSKLIVKTKEAETEQVFIFKEYQTVDGMVFPMHISVQQGPSTYDLALKAYHIDPEIGDSLFSKGGFKSVQQTAKDYLGTFYALDYAKLATFYTDESYWYDPSTSIMTPGIQKSIGKDRIIADLQSGFNGVQEASYAIEKEFYSGPYVSVWGTYSYKIPAKFFSGLMHSDAVFEFTLPMVTHLVIKDNKVLEHLEYADWTDWAKQAQSQAAQIQ